MRTVPDRGGCRPAFLIAGAGGMLGTALQYVLAKRGIRLVAHGEADFDITDPVVVKRRVADFAESLAADERGVLVNAAAFTDVERAEDEPALAYLVNEHGPVLLARAAVADGLAFVHLSTDYVYDGLKAGPYVETDEPDPISVYGTTKLAGDNSVFAEDSDALIVRTAWSFGPGGVNFPVKILEAARTRPRLNVVDDEVGSPTYTRDLVAGIVALVDAGATGLFHLTGSGSCSRFEFAAEVLRLAGSTTPLTPVKSDAFPSKARRPHNSVLDCSKAAALGAALPEWRDSLAEYVRELPENR